MKRLIAIAIGVALAGLGTVALGARNSSGTYSRPSGHPVVTKTPISSTLFNALTADIATEFSDSLSRSGKGGMLAPMRTVDGNATLPAWSFTSETGTGFYRIGTADVGLSIGGTKKVEFTSGLDTFTDPVSFLGSTTVAGVATFNDPAAFADPVTLSSTLTVAGAATFTDPVTVGTATGTQHAATKAYVDVLYNRVTKLTSNVVTGSGTWGTVTGMTSQSYDASAVAAFTCNLLVSLGSGSIAFGVTGPASPSVVHLVFMYRSPSTVSFDMATDVTAYNTGTEVAPTTAVQAVIVQGTVTLGATAGALSLRVYSTAASSTVYAGSTCTWN